MNKGADRNQTRAAFCVVRNRLQTLNRLKKRRQFLDVQRSGIRTATPGFVLQVGQISPDADADGKEGGSAPRIGYTVSRKVGNAVARNRVKRRLRELARIVMADNARPGRDYVLIGRRGALNRPFGQMASDLAGALGKLDVNRNE